VAFRFREAVIESVEQLKPHPRHAISRFDFRPSFMAGRGFEAIRIYYMETSGRLRVVRILHGKRNVRRILRQEKAEE
jgi:plasmid stabilization system protein ParE